MDLAKLVVAVGIAFILAFFLSSTISTFYKPPKSDLSCLGSLGSCDDLIKTQCGKSPSGRLGEDVNSYYNCESRVYSSQEYKDCSKNSKNNQQTCLEKQKSGLENYQITYYIILIFSAIVLIILGFFLLHEESIGVGFIGGGVLITIGAIFFSTIAILLTASLFGAFSGLGGLTGGLSPELDQQFGADGALNRVDSGLGEIDNSLDDNNAELDSIVTGAAISGVSKNTSTLSYLNIICLLIILIILVLFAHFRLEKKNEM